MSNQVFLLFISVLLSGVIWSYGAFQSHFSEAHIYKEQVEILRQAVEREQLKTLLAERDKQIAELKSKLANNESKQAELRAADAKPFDWLKIEQEQEIPYVEPGALADTVEEVDSSVAPRTISLDQPGPEAASKTD